MCTQMCTAMQALYKIRFIQVNGGSEFMKGYYPKDFEEVCRELGLTLFVPPTKPKYNGKEEFYEGLREDSILGTQCVGAIRELMRFLQKYNSYRLHSSLHGPTPLEYISKYSSGDASCLTSV